MSSPASLEMGIGELTDQLSASSSNIFQVKTDEVKRPSQPTVFEESIQSEEAPVNGFEQEEDLNDILSDIEELIESAVDVDVSKYPPGASVRKKRVLEFRPADPFSVLPDGWIEITHNSGLPVYLVTFSRVFIWDYFSTDQLESAHSASRTFLVKALFVDTMFLRPLFLVTSCENVKLKSRHRRSRRM